jgi:hypothetical protein
VCVWFFREGGVTKCRFDTGHRRVNASSAMLMALAGGFSEALSPSSAVPVRTASHVYASTKKGYYYKVLTATHSGGGGGAGKHEGCVCVYTAR